ncbi:MAG TPA: contact-dependent growth inhibition system immunity protein [Actinoplanes sp.]
MQETDQSLEEIENDAWGDPPAGATRLTATVHELRRRPVEQLGIEDLRVLVAQQVGLDVIVPLALARLEENPLIEGDFYPGDLLAAVLRVPPAYWRSHPDEAARLRTIAGSADLDELDAETRAEVVAFRGNGT